MIRGQLVALLAERINRRLRAYCLDFRNPKPQRSEETIRLADVMP